jgi:hypothetical protein
MYNYPLHRPTVLATALLLGLSSTSQAEYPSSISLTEGQAVAGQFIILKKYLA